MQMTLAMRSVNVQCCKLNTARTAENSQYVQCIDHAERWREEERDPTVPPTTI